MLNFYQPSEKFSTDVNSPCLLKTVKTTVDGSIRRKKTEGSSFKSNHLGISKPNNLFEREDEQTFTYEM